MANKSFSLVRNQWEQSNLTSFCWMVKIVLAAGLHGFHFRIFLKMDQILLLLNPWVWLAPDKCYFFFFLKNCLSAVMSSPGKGYLPGGASAREWPPLFSKWSVSLLPVEVGGKVPLDCPHLPELPILQNHQGDLVFKLDLLEDIVLAIVYLK